MATKKKAETTKERATVSRERRLALALVAVLDYRIDNPGETGDSNSEVAARDLLAEMGYGDLEGIPRRVAAVTEQLTAAIAAGDGKLIAQLGLELERAKAGKSVKVAEVAE
jgi:hypothetical protein